MTAAPLEVPVALLVFNRPDLTAKVFAQVRAAAPRRLFVIADGPRTEAERATCLAVRAEINVDWPCEVSTLYADTNLGCQARPASGIDWVFSHCEEAIFLEDDCVPSPAFFRYCGTLLERYRADERVMCIGGTSLFPGAPRPDESYYFSRYGTTWGWATWRRAWLHFDVGMSDWPRFKRARGMRDVFESREERWFWTALFDAQYEGRIVAWDYAWFFARLANGGLSTGPYTNLVANLGFRADATNTARMPALFERACVAHDEWTVAHPSHVLPNRDVDAFNLHAVFNPRGMTGVAMSHVRRLIEDVLPRRARS